MKYKVKVSLNGDVKEGAIKKELEKDGFIVNQTSEVPFEATMTRKTAQLNPAHARRAILAVRRVAKRAGVTTKRFEGEFVR